MSDYLGLVDVEMTWDFSQIGDLAAVAARYETTVDEVLRAIERTARAADRLVD